MFKIVFSEAFYDLENYQVLSLSNIINIINDKKLKAIDFIEPFILYINNEYKVMLNDLNDRIVSLNILLKIIKNLNCMTLINFDLEEEILLFINNNNFNYIDMKNNIFYNGMLI